MKFTDKTYLYLQDASGRKSYRIEFTPDRLELDYTYPKNITIVLTINPDNSMGFAFDPYTLGIMNSPAFYLPQNKRDNILRIVHDQLLLYPYPDAQWELKYE